MLTPKRVTDVTPPRMPNTGDQFLPQQLVVRPGNEARDARVGGVRR